MNKTEPHVSHEANRVDPGKATPNNILRRSKKSCEHFARNGLLSWIGWRGRKLNLRTRANAV